MVTIVVFGLLNPSPIYEYPYLKRNVLNNQLNALVSKSGMQFLIIPNLENLKKNAKIA